ncbi:hypothetical protein HRM2_21740 [Desulforapulum autotrophicum HRM2]|uniref:Uncharacterized protein n=1 Tax=Desulforapulum autotrophicum (strain ATCC 43914 / DSM 3382 / VKM B-1955 / HRM2) TaxID=177437 RepID=C0QDK8_DESAH|nr:hypothetical protein [Desulforapulum autotrophicum]ACN15272.1 hypothetical protein HRM2_21740 [Desulforapulum autotrophicum HRM2]
MTQVDGLKKTYYLMTGPALAGLVVSGMARTKEIIPLWHMEKGGQVLLLVICAVTCFAAPLMMRTLFAHSLKDRHGAQADRFFKFQQRLLLVSQLTPWWTMFVVVAEFEKFHGSAIILMGLYAVYYYYPSQRRIAFDQRIFRVK